MRFGCPWSAVAAWLAAGMAAGPACYSLEESDSEPDGGADESADGVTDGATETLPPASTWLWEIAPTAGRGYANAVAEADDGGVIVAGWVEAGGGAWVTRFAPDGSILQDVSFTGWLSAIAPHPAGGFVLAGLADGAMLWRLDASGVPIWGKSSGWGRAQALVPCGDGFLVAGGVSSTSSGTGAWLARIDADGNTLWAKDLAGVSLASRSAVATAHDGGALVSGLRGTYSDTGEVWVARFAPDGAIVWQVWTGSSATFNQGPGIVELSDGDVVVTHGSDEGDIRVLRLDASGVARWEEFVGGPEEERGALAIEGPDRGVVVAATETGFPSGRSVPDLWLFALDASGGLLWQRSVESDMLDLEHGLIPTRDGAFIAVSGGCCGSMVAKLRFDGSFDGECAALSAADGAVHAATPGLVQGDVVVSDVPFVLQDRTTGSAPNTTFIERLCGY